MKSLEINIYEKLHCTSIIEAGARSVRDATPSIISHEPSWQFSIKIFLCFVWLLSRDRLFSDLFSLKLVFRFLRKPNEKISDFLHIICFYIFFNILAAIFAIVLDTRVHYFLPILTVGS